MTTVGQQPDVVRDAREAPQREAQAKAAQAERDAPLANRMRTEAGRRDVWQDLAALFEPSWRHDAERRCDTHAMAYAEGDRCVALDLWKRARRADHEGLIQTVAEGIRREGVQ